MTKTEQAIKLVEEGMTVRKAAREVDVSESAVHAAIKRKRAEQLAASGVCPCCGQMINRSALK